jgi:phosphohistidine phosphatase
MQVLVMRHGIAFERDAWNQDDALRPLTPEGEKRTRRAAWGLKFYVPQVQLVATSPLTRAAQTAQIVASAFGAPLRVWDELAGMAEDENWDVSQLVERLNTREQSSTIVLVGHEPGCSRLLSQMVAPNGTLLRVNWKKASVACVEFENSVQFGEGVLQWIAPPKLLRGLGRSREASRDMR